VVIGSGPGGSTAAMVLAEAGWDVVVLEKGPNRFGDLTSPTPTTPFGNDELKDRRGFEEQLPDLEPRTFRATDAEATPREVGVVNNLPTLVGGGTVHWDAKVPRFWDLDFKKASILGPVEGADVVDWPFTYDELEPTYGEVEQLIGVAGDADAVNTGPVGVHARRSGPYPMPPGPAQYGSAKYAAGAESLGLHPFPFPMALNSEPYDDRPACVNCGFCSGYGCPIHARVGGLAPLRRALLTGRVEVRADTFVARIDVDGRRATGVTTLDLDGNEEQVPADFVVLAASAIESIRLALLSELPDPNGLVGRGLMFHWFTNGFGFFLNERIHGYRGRDSSHALEDFADPDFPGAREFAAANGLPYFRGGILEMGGCPRPIEEANIYRGLLPALSPAKPFGSALKQLMRASLFRDRLAGIQMVGEDLAQRTNTVDLDPDVRDVRGVPVPRITYHPHQHELVAQQFYIPLLEELIAASGADVAGAVASNSTDEVPSLVGGLIPETKHILGGLRMGDDPATSVVDADGLFRGLDNVGVADASVFATGGAHNPTLTLMAVALRNARRWVGAVGPAPTTTTGAPGASADDGGGGSGAAVPVAVGVGVLAAGGAALAARRRARG
jgi:choline dehydrogenase-like flavoprotein